MGVRCRSLQRHSTWVVFGWCIVALQWPVLSSESNSFYHISSSSTLFFALYVYFVVSQVQDSDVLENDWLNLYAEVAMYTLKENDMSLFESWLPLEIKKVVVQTFEDVKSNEKLKAGNAIFYFSFKNLNAPPHGLCQDHRVIIRRSTDGLPGHICLDINSCTGRNIFK